MCISFTALYVCREPGLWLKRELYCHRMGLKSIIKRQVMNILYYVLTAMLIVSLHIYV